MAASNKSKDLYSLLNQYKLPKDSHEIYTHTKIKGGKYKVPDENLDELSNLLLYSPLTQVRANIAADTVVVSEDRARLLEFQLAP